MKKWIRLQIASVHGRLLPRLLSRAAAMYLGAYNNIYNWDMSTNGELRALRLVLQKVEGEIFDVGANVGQWTTVALPHLSGRRLHCFEPIPTAYSTLRDTVPQSEMVVLNQIGLSNVTGTIDLNYSEKATTISSSFELVYPDESQIRIPCAFTTGDAYIRENGIGPIAFIKIDVEGMEMAVLEGLEGSLRAGSVAALQFEHGESHIFSGHTLKSFVDKLATYDYDLYLVFPKSLVRVEYEFALENYGGQNLLALRRDIVPS